MDLESRTVMYASEVQRAEGFLNGRGLSIEDASLYRLGCVCDDSPESAPYKGRLAIPYLTPSGVRDIRFRCLEDHRCKEHGHSKYLSRAGAAGLLYNVSALWRDSDTIAICEGELDAVVMDLFSGIPAVGVPGANMWRPHFRKLFADYDRVLVLGDGDDAGKAFALVIVSKLENAVAVTLPQGMDVNDVLLSEGVLGVEELAS